MEWNCRQAGGPASGTKVEVEFNGYLYRDGNSVFGTWLELPFAYGFDCLFIEAIPAALQDSNLRRLAN